MSDFENRLSNVEKARATSPLRESPGRTAGHEEECIFVVGKNGRVRPTPEEVRDTIGIKVEDQRFWGAAATVVGVMGTQKQFAKWRFLAQGTELWISPKRTPAQNKAEAVWREIKAWVSGQRVFVADIDQQGRKVSNVATQRAVVSMNQNRDKIVWHDDKIRLEWFGRAAVG